MTDKSTTHDSIEDGVGRAIVHNLKPQFDPVALVWSDSIPSNAIQFKEGKFGCVLNLFAEASKRGRVAGGSRDTIVCDGAQAALGLGYEIVATRERLENRAAVFSKGLASAPDVESYRAKLAAAPTSWRPLLEYGERRHCSFDLARNWLLNRMPRYEVPNRYVLFKPLSKINPDDNVRVVIFPLNPVELSGLVTLLLSVVDGTNPVQVPPGADCFRIAGYACAQTDAETPHAVLGMLNFDGREVMRRKFRDDILTLSIPVPLLAKMEREANDSIFQIPGWLKLRTNR